jgi:hypothetical protein
MTKKLDLSQIHVKGEIYNYWEIISDEITPHVKGMKVYCKCLRCNETEGWKFYSRLKTGRTRMCRPCYVKYEIGVKPGKYPKKKYYYFYTIWRDMKARCYNPKSIGYDRYGGKCIDIDPEWRNNFGKFCEWCLKGNPNQDKSLTIDRIDNDLGYWDFNLKWSTRQEQIWNKSNTKEIVGAYKSESGRYESRITCKRITHQLGTFNTEEEAGEAYDLKSLELHGDRACLNFPEKVEEYKKILKERYKDGN